MKTKLLTEIKNLGQDIGRGAKRLTSSLGVGWRAARSYVPFRRAQLYGNRLYWTPPFKQRQASLRVGLPFRVGWKARRTANPLIGSSYVEGFKLGRRGWKKGKVLIHNIPEEGEYKFARFIRAGKKSAREYLAPSSLGLTAGYVSGRYPLVTGSLGLGMAATGGLVAHKTLYSPAKRLVRVLNESSDSRNYPTAEEAMRSSGIGDYELLEPYLQRNQRTGNLHKSSYFQPLGGVYLAGPYKRFVRVRRRKVEPTKRRPSLYYGPKVSSTGTRTSGYSFSPMKEVEESEGTRFQSPVEENRNKFKNQRPIDPDDDSISEEKKKRLMQERNRGEKILRGITKNLDTPTQINARRLMKSIREDPRAITYLERLANVGGNKNLSTLLTLAALGLATYLTTKNQLTRGKPTTTAQRIRDLQTEGTPTTTVGLLPIPRMKYPNRFRNRMLASPGYGTLRDVDVLPSTPLYLSNRTNDIKKIVQAKERTSAKNRGFIKFGSMRKRIRKGPYVAERRLVRQAWKNFLRRSESAMRRLRLKVGTENLKRAAKLGHRKQREFAFQLEATKPMQGRMLSRQEIKELIRNPRIKIIRGTQNTAGIGQPQVALGHLHWDRRVPAPSFQDMMITSKLGEMAHGRNLPMQPYPQAILGRKGITFLGSRSLTRSERLRDAKRYGDLVSRQAWSNWSGIKPGVVDPIKRFRRISGKRPMSVFIPFEEGKKYRKILMPGRTYKQDRKLARIADKYGWNEKGVRINPRDFEREYFGKRRGGIRKGLTGLAMGTAGKLFPRIRRVAVKSTRLLGRGSLGYKAKRSIVAFRRKAAFVPGFHHGIMGDRAKWVAGSAKGPPKSGMFARQRTMRGLKLASGTSKAKSYFAGERFGERLRAFDRGFRRVRPDRVDLSRMASRRKGIKFQRVGGLAKIPYKMGRFAATDPIGAGYTAAIGGSALTALGLRRRKSLRNNWQA